MSNFLYFSNFAMNRTGPLGLTDRSIGDVPCSNAGLLRAVNKAISSSKVGSRDFGKEPRSLADWRVASSRIPYSGVSTFGRHDEPPSRPCVPCKTCTFRHPLPRKSVQEKRNRQFPLFHRILCIRRPQASQFFPARSVSYHADGSSSALSRRIHGIQRREQGTENIVEWPEECCSHRMQEEVRWTSDRDPPLGKPLQNFHIQGVTELLIQFVAIVLQLRLKCSLASLARYFV